MEFRIYPSEEGFEEISLLATMIAVYTNAHMYPFDALYKLPEAERLEEIETLKDIMRKRIG